MSRMPALLSAHASYHAWLTSLHGYEGQVRFYSFFPPRPEGEITPEGFIVVLFEDGEIRKLIHAR